MITHDLLALYWPEPSLDGDACLDEFLAAGFSLEAIEAWWDAGIATADGAQCLQAAGVRPTQCRFVHWVSDALIIDNLLAALAPIVWVPSGPYAAEESAENGPYEAIASPTQCAVWNAGTLIGQRSTASRPQARRMAEQMMRTAARRQLPPWERLEAAN